MLGRKRRREEALRQEQERQEQDRRIEAKRAAAIGGVAGAIASINAESLRRFEQETRRIEQAKRR
ncbi:hypothetical protein ACFQ08_00830 [Streptosporangium algeriense]|uniref:Uncharacterized protein n=1 Tax=Streptosporangium algeriense TaxID=1682748 RepID=A0ABW3DJF2_9ACTN